MPAKLGASLYARKARGHLLGSRLLQCCRHARPFDVLLVALLLATTAVVISLLPRGNTCDTLPAAACDISGPRKRHATGRKDDDDGKGYHRSQLLTGAAFLSPLASATTWSGLRLVNHSVTMRVVTAFSPFVEDRVGLMFEDKFGECRFHALGPAMALWQGVVVATIRVFLPQYLLYYIGHSEYKPIETWQENYVYTMQLSPANYTPLDAGFLLGIPTPANLGSTYRKDGPMDPRAFVFKDRLFLIYHSYGMPAPNTTARCRMYFWDYERSVKRLITVSGVPLLPEDRDWSPIVVGGDNLYLVYSFDPLRVLRCDPDKGHCWLHFSQTFADQMGFQYSSASLKGGTPFVEYVHPFYFSVAYSSMAQPGTVKAAYAAHLVVISLEPWGLVYVSDSIEGPPEWLNSKELVSKDYVAGPFWYPTSLLIRDENTIDVGCHLNDHSSYLVRLAGTKRLLSEVVELYVRSRRLAAELRHFGGAADTAATLPAGAVQSYVRDCHLRRLHSSVTPKSSRL